ncbi:MAG: hypothetical protein ABSG90_00470 [Dehalococcoidia bacterium]
MPPLNIIFQIITLGFGSYLHWIFPLIGLILFILILIPTRKRIEDEQKTKPTVLRKLLSNARTSAQAIISLKADANISNWFSTNSNMLMGALNRYKELITELEKDEYAISEAESLLNVLHLGRSLLEQIGSHNILEQLRTELDANSKEVIQAIDNFQKHNWQNNGVSSKLHSVQSWTAFIYDPKNNDLKVALISARARAKGLTYIKTYDAISNPKAEEGKKIIRTMRNAYYRYEDAIWLLRKRRNNYLEARTLTDLFRTGQATLNTVYQSMINPDASKPEIDSDSEKIIQSINHVLNDSSNLQSEKNAILDMDICDVDVGYFPSTTQPAIIVEVDLHPGKKMQLAKISLEYENRIEEGIIRNLTLPHYLEQDETYVVMFKTNYTPNHLQIREGMLAKSGQPRQKGKLIVKADAKKWESLPFPLFLELDDPTIKRRDSDRLDS